MQRFFRITLFIILLALVISLLFGQVHLISINGIDYARFSWDLPIIKLALVFGLLLFFYQLYLQLRKVLTHKNGFIWCVVIINILFLIFHFVWLRIFPLTGYVDMNDVLENVFRLLSNDYSAFAKGGYLYIHSNNIPIVLFVEQFARMFNLNEWYKLAYGMQLLNIIFMQIVLNLIMYNVLLISNKVNSTFSGFVSILFFPFIAYITYVYNDIPSLLFIIASTTLIIMASKKHIYLNAILVFLSGFMLSIGNLLRPVGPVLLIASVLYLLVSRKGFERFLFALIVILGYFSFNYDIDHTLINRTIVSEAVYDHAENNQLEILNGVCKGTSLGNDALTPGFHLQTCDFIFKDNVESDPDVIEKLYFSQIDSNLRSNVNITNIYLKFLYHWGDGNFESDIIHGINREATGYTEFRTEYSRLRTLVQDSWLARVLYTYGHVFWLSMLIVIAIGLLRSKIFTELIYIISILGFIGFYMIWEISPHYNFVILYAFIILFSVYYSDAIAWLSIKFGRGWKHE